MSFVHKALPLAARSRDPSSPWSKSGRTRRSGLYDVFTIHSARSIYLLSLNDLCFTFEGGWDRALEPTFQGESCHIGSPFYELSKVYATLPAPLHEIHCFLWKQPSSSYEVCKHGPQTFRSCLTKIHESKIQRLIIVNAGSWKEKGAEP